MLEFDIGKGKIIGVDEGRKTHNVSPVADGVPVTP